MTLEVSIERDSAGRLHGYVLEGARARMATNGS